MPIVDENRLKGNFGASYVAALLSSECLVRPVAIDTDVGVDLYCETVADNRPFLHFWVQVKAGDQCRLSGDGSRASCSFSVDHLAYWDNQPVPVFAALVPTEWPVEDDPPVYVVDLVTCLLGGVPSAQQTCTLDANFTWEPGNRDNVRNFLEVAVPNAAARLLCRKGVVGAAPTPRPSYELTIPGVPVSRFQTEILDQLRRTAANSILFLRSSGELGQDTQTFRRTMAGILEQYEDDPHWENFMARAISLHVDGEYDTAAALYGRARDSILGDKNVRNQEKWIKIRQEVESLLEKAENHSGLQAAD